MQTALINEIRHLRGMLQQGTVFEHIGIRDVTFAYDSDPPVLKQASLEVERNTLLALVGRNGIGKTTFLRLLTGSIKPQSGNVLPKDMSLEISYSASDGRDLNPYLKVVTVIQMISEKLGQPVTTETLKTVTLWEKRQNYIWELSSGERKKLSLFRAFALGRDAVILDEPEAHIDSDSRDLLAALINKFRGQVTILMTSHNISLVKTCGCMKAMEMVTTVNKTEFVLKTL
jgi:ABC-type multidrug transport system ATPase subunit